MITSLNNDGDSVLFQTSFARYYILQRNVRCARTPRSSNHAPPRKVSLRENRKSIALSTARYRSNGDIKKKGCMHIALRQIAIFYEFNRLSIRVSFLFLLPF